MCIYCFNFTFTVTVSLSASSKKGEKLFVRLQVSQMSKTPVAPINYKRMHQSLLQANGRLLQKLEKAQRQASFWKRQQVELVKTIWGWTTNTPEDKSTLWLTMPGQKRTKKRKAPAAAGFIFPPGDAPHSPKTRVKKATMPGKNTTPKKAKRQTKHSTSTDSTIKRRMARLNKQLAFS